MTLPKSLEQQVQCLVAEAKKFDPQIEVYEFWLQLRVLLSVILYGNAREREIAWRRFEAVYTKAVGVSITALHGQRYNSAQKHMIDSFLDHWQGARELVRSVIARPRRVFKPDDVSLAAQYFLDSNDLEILGALGLQPHEIKPVFEFIGAIKLRCDDKKRRIWHSVSDSVYIQSWQDCRFVISYKQGRFVRLISAERDFAAVELEQFSDLS